MTNKTLSMAALLGVVGVLSAAGSAEARSGRRGGGTYVYNGSQGYYRNSGAAACYAAAPVATYPQTYAPPQTYAQPQVMTPSVPMMPAR